MNTDGMAFIDTSIAQELERRGRVIAPFRGVSMLPMLRQDRDLVIIEKAAGRLERGDVGLYRRKGDGALVLHRVLEAGPEGYVFLGDNCAFAEKGIADEQILGRLVGFVHGGRQISANSPGYRRYVRLWLAIRPLRMGCARLFSALYRLKRRFLGRLRPAA